MINSGIKTQSITLTVSNLDQPSQLFNSLHDASHLPVSTSLSFTSNGNGNSQINYGQLLGQLLNLAQYINPKAQMAKMALDLVGQLANHAIEQYNNSNDGVGGAGTNNYGIGSSLHFNSEENSINQEISDLLNRAQAMRSNSYKKPSAKCNKQNYQKREAQALNNSIAQLSTAIANGSIPPHLAKSANDLIGVMSKRAGELSTSQEQTYTFSNGLGQLLFSMYNGKHY